MKKILITGANGYIGARLSVLLSKNNLVTALCHNMHQMKISFSNTVHKIIEGDITDKDLVDSISNNTYDVVIHLVSLDHKKSNLDLTSAMSVNVIPVWNLLDNFSNKKNIKKFIYFSTSQVYGNIPNKNITEDFIPSPNNYYGLTHYISENICNYYNSQSDIDCLNLRLTNSYGSPVFSENNCWWLVVNDLCRMAYNKKKIKLSSDGSPNRDFIHSMDIYNAVKILISDFNYPNNTFHISSGYTYTILELANKIKEVFFNRYNKKIKVLFKNDSTLKNNLGERYTIDNSRLKSIGFNIKVKLIEGINEIFDYLDKNNE